MNRAGLDWFDEVYRAAGDDPGAVPWADLAPKPPLMDWLRGHPGNGRSALDVGCGLGDNAEALAATGYRVTGFDLSDTAIGWARKRFPGTSVAYHAASLFEPPPEWIGAFDLVHECFTLQALRGDYRAAAFSAVAELVAPGGTLLVITFVGPDGAAADGPPWPLTPTELARFDRLGFRRESEVAFELARRRGMIGGVRIEFRR